MAAGGFTGDKSGNLGYVKSMATVNVDLPADLVSVSKLYQGNVSQEAAKVIARAAVWPTPNWQAVGSVSVP